ncbi:MAG: hypothetical protein ACR2JI_12630 [Mycobacterium sp.]
MGYPAPPPQWTPPSNWMPAPPPPPRNTADVTVSVLFIVLTVLLGGASTVLGLMSLAFLDYCPPATCSADGAVTSVLAALAIAGVIGIAGAVTAIVRLGARKTAWPFAVGTFGACVVVLAFGVVAYTAAVS